MVALFCLASPLCLSKFVAVEMISHQHSPFPFESMPAWISIALALPISTGILLSTTEFCWGVPGTVNSKITPKLCLSHFFWRLLFSPLLSSLIFYISIPYFFDNPIFSKGSILKFFFKSNPQNFH